MKRGDVEWDPIQRQREIEQKNKIKKKGKEKKPCPFCAYILYVQVVC